MIWILMRNWNCWFYFVTKCWCWTQLEITWKMLMTSNKIFSFLIFFLTQFIMFISKTYCVFELVIWTFDDEFIFSNRLLCYAFHRLKSLRRDLREAQTIENQRRKEISKEKWKKTLAERKKKQDDIQKRKDEKKEAEK